MTRLQQALAGRWRWITVFCWLLALSGAAVIGWSWYSQLADEADRRGVAVSTLADDVRILRAQVQAEGATPKAPDPSQAVEGLDDRTRVPVPIPGPRGPQGEPGKDAPTITPSPGPAGPSGAPGQPGADSTVPGPVGPAGPQGEQGPKGDTGEQGPAGPSCPNDYHLEAPSWDPDALVCRRDGSSQPEEPGNGNGGVLSAGLDPQRRQYA